MAFDFLHRLMTMQFQKKTKQKFIAPCLIGFIFFNPHVVLMCKNDLNYGILYCFLVFYAKTASRNILALFLINDAIVFCIINN